MMLTLAILKPDCVSRGLTGKAIDFIESKGFEIVRMKKVALSRQQAEEFYRVHQDKNFFPELIKFMTSGPCIPLTLRHENAVDFFRTIIGNTDPQKAEKGTLRQLYGENVQRNVVHGADSEDNARQELAFFFPFMDILE